MNPQGTVPYHRQSARKKACRDLRLQLNARWRRKILKRDRRRCCICEKEDRLELAHITSVDTFLESAHKISGRPLTFAANYLEYPLRCLKKALRQSYRDDNLVMLCQRCHYIQGQHMPCGIFVGMRQRAFARRVGRNNLARVLGFLAGFVKARGWTFLPKENKDNT